MKKILLLICILIITSCDNHKNVSLHTIVVNYQYGTSDTMQVYYHHDRLYLDNGNLSTCINKFPFACGVRSYKIIN